MLKYRFAEKEDVKKIKNLLQENDLPVEGVEQFYKDFIVTENGRFVGAVGLEIYDHAALFRSLAVDKNHRSQKVGKALIERIKAHALLNNVKDFYLLTTTAIPSNVPHAVFTKAEKVIAVDAWSPIMEKYQ